MKRRKEKVNKYGCDGQEDTPVPISNTEVKLLNVEGTSTSRTGRIENSQTKHKSLERVIFCLKVRKLTAKINKQVWHIRVNRKIILKIEYRSS